MKFILHCFQCDSWGCPFWTCGNRHTAQTNGSSNCACRPPTITGAFWAAPPFLSWPLSSDFFFFSGCSHFRGLNDFLVWLRKWYGGGMVGGAAPVESPFVSCSPIPRLNSCISAWPLGSSPTHTPFYHHSGCNWAWWWARLLSSHFSCEASLASFVHVSISRRPFAQFPLLPLFCLLALPIPQSSLTLSFCLSISQFHVFPLFPFAPLKLLQSSSCSALNFFPRFLFWALSLSPLGSLSWCSEKPLFYLLFLLCLHLFSLQHTVCGQSGAYFYSI